MKNQVLSNWENENKKVTKLLSEVSDEQLAKQVAPGKNTGVYLLGHLIGANDSLTTLFGLGPKMYPELEHIFLRSPDGAVAEKPSTTELRAMWEKQTEVLAEHLNKFTDADWHSRHTAVTEEDFAKEPNRNKLNVLITRTLHQSYHLGQLALLK